jgi:hypothetical protein
LVAAPEAKIFACAATSGSGQGALQRPALSGRRGSLALVLYLLLAFMKALHDRRSPWYLRGLIREPLRKIRVVLLHDVEHRFLGEPAVVFGQQPVHVSELFVGHGHRASAAIPEYTATY